MKEEIKRLSASSTFNVDGVMSLSIVNMGSSPIQYGEKGSEVLSIGEDEVFTIGPFDRETLSGERSLLIPTGGSVQVILVRAERRAESTTSAAKESGTTEIITR